MITMVFGFPGDGMRFQALKLGYCGRRVPRVVRRVLARGSLHRSYIIGRLYYWGCFGGFLQENLNDQP